jgi:cell division protein FtsQ
MRRAAPRGPRRPWPGHRTAALLVLTVLLGAGLVWLRDSSLVAVERVTVVGADGRSAPQIRTALVRAARDMTTLHVREDELASAVSAYPIVKRVEASPRLPDGLEVRVVQHDPVAAVMRGARRVPVAADGTVLADEPASAALPLVPGGGLLADGRLTDRRTLSAVALMGAAPAPLRSLVSGVHRDGAGLHVSLDNGPQLDFGAPVRLRDKWRAAAGVLADPRAAGASYIDLRAPQRPVAGPFAPATAPSGPPPTTPEQDPSSVAPEAVSEAPGGGG